MKIALITDIHENIDALKEALRRIEAQKCEEIISLGDITGFSKKNYNHIKKSDVNECIRLVKENCRYSVIGNHDLFSIRKQSSFHIENKIPDNWYSMSLEERKKINDKIWYYADEIETELIPDSYDYLKSLPEKLTLKHDNKNFLFSHFIYPDITGSSIFFPKNKKDFKIHFEKMNNENISISFAGHGHISGFLLVSKSRISYREFTFKKLKDKPQIIILPSIGGEINGFCIFDIKKLEFSAVKI